MSMDFSHSLTTELFDRTQEQRRARTAEVVRLRSTHQVGDGFDVEAAANEVMFDMFLYDVDRDIDRRARFMIGQELNTDGPSLDTLAVRRQASAEVVADLAVLHAALPLPGLERIAR